MAGYGDDAGLTAWLAESGHALPVGAPTPAILRQRASDYLDGLYEARFIGLRTDPLSQERAWPRTGAVVHSVAVPDDTVPGAVEKASYVAALYEANNPDGLTVATSASRSVKRKKIDVIETEFFEGSGSAAADATIRLSAVEGLLAPFLRPEGVASIGLWSVGSAG